MVHDVSARGSSENTCCAETGAEFALKQVQLKSMSRVERQEAIDEVLYFLCTHLTAAAHSLDKVIDGQP